MTIAIDFDGTIVKHEYPKIGADINAFPVIRDLIAAKHKIILYTMRSGKELQEAIEHCKQNGIVFDSINSNPSQAYWTKSPKIYAHLYIDDAALGAPLWIDTKGLEKPFIDWVEVRKYLVANEYLKG